MGRTMPTMRDRWVVIHGPAKPRPVKARESVTPHSFQVVDFDGDVASTATIYHEDEHDDSPIPIGILDPEGGMICRIPYRDTVPMGFHYTRDQYDEYGNFIGDDEQFYYDDEEVE